MGAFNNEATLETAMRSILHQTLTELELIVIDDGSLDGSHAVAQRVAASDPRVRVIAMGRNVGISRSLNEGLTAARAGVVAIQDADDWSAATRLERQLAVLDARPEVAVVGSRMHEVDETGAQLTPRTAFVSGDVNYVLMRFNPIPNTSAAFRREIALEVGGYDPRYSYAMEYDLWLRVAETHVIHALDEPLSTRRMSRANVAARKERQQIAESLKIRARALQRRRTLVDAHWLIVPALSYVTPLGIKRAARRRAGMAP